MTTSTTTPYAISLDSIRAAAERIRGHAHRTPVVTCQALDALATERLSGPRVRLFFKCENLQKVGAFKYRGACNAVSACLGQSPTAELPTILTHSSGNHAQAVALAARDRGCRAIIIMPENAPVVKQNAVRGYGAEIVHCGTAPSDRERVADEWVAKTGGHLVHPSNDPDVMSGQGTAALELLEQVEAEHSTTLDAVVVPVGGGGLCSGVAMAVKSINPEIQVFGVEPEGADDASRSYESKQLQGHISPPKTIADGLRSTLGDKNFPVIRDLVDAIGLVSEDEIITTMRLMWERMKLVVEPSGAVAASGVLFNKLPMTQQDKEVINVGVIISGGNVDLDHLPWL